MLKKNSNEHYNSFSKIPQLDYEPDSEFLEWYMVEGYERISELSRCLRTFLNYRKNVIQLKFSTSSETDNNLKNDSILKREGELSSLYTQYTALVKKIGVENAAIAENIQILIEKVKIQPYKNEITLLKEIKHIGREMWKIIHILSEFEVQLHPYILQTSIKIACVLSSVEGIFFSLFSNFYCELKLCYLQLEKELSELLLLNKAEQFKKKKKMKGVRILE